MTADGPAPAGRGRLGLLIFACGVATAWLAFLAFLAFRTANPVTLNRAQLLSSDAVVIASPLPGSGKSGINTLRVEKVLAGVGVPDAVRFGVVEPERFSQAGRYVVPLRESEGGYVVTPTPPALNGVPLVYPATEDAVRAAEEILKTASDRPYE